MVQSTTFCSDDSRKIGGDVVIGGKLTQNYKKIIHVIWPKKVSSEDKGNI